MPKLTRQGVKDLGNNNNNARPARRCRRHNFEGPFVPVGYEWAIDEYGDYYKEPVYGKRCTWCGERSKGG